MRKIVTGLVGILSSLVLVGCVDSTRPETYKQDDYKDSSLDVVIDEPVIEEPVAQIIKPESPKP